MRTLLTLGLVAAVALVLAPVSEACPASYVKSLGQNSNSHTNHAKAQEVADGYMENRGINPSSPAGQTIKPYVTGTAIVESNYNRREFDLNNDPVSKLVDTALGPNAGHNHNGSFESTGGHGIGGSYKSHMHFNRHFGHGIQESGQGGGASTTKMGG